GRGQRAQQGQQGQQSQGQQGQGQQAQQGQQGQRGQGQQGRPQATGKEAMNLNANNQGPERAANANPRDLGRPGSEQPDLPKGRQPGADFPDQNPGANTGQAKPEGQKPPSAEGQAGQGGPNPKGQ